ncbi:MAG TPA: FAD-dependent oxidoreductase [Actinomycetota bacterium]|nr:FAD-dependent oxidoreductase [Actinomycetota bacterium]
MAGRPTFAIVGAGLAGGTAAATLREEGFDGRIVLLGEDPELPYERPPLSKRYLRGEQPREELEIRPLAWWNEHDVELRLGRRVRGLDAGGLELDDGERIAFDRALLATGVRNRHLDVPGADLEGIHQLRRIEDADRLRAHALTSRSAVIVGMGFIGAEVAASLRQLGLDVTVVEIEGTALERILGPELGRVVEAIHRDHGVDLRFGRRVARFEGDGRVERVVTDDGAAIDCDLAVVGIGTDASTGLASGGGRGLPVGPTLESAMPGVYAAGDVALHDHPVFGPVRVEHFDNALKMGEHAARAMLGSAEPFDDPHWFWSDQFEHEIQMGGVTVTDDMTVRGSLEERAFCAFFRDPDGVLVSAVSLDLPREVRRAMPLIRARVVCDPADLSDAGIDLRRLVHEEAR